MMDSRSVVLWNGIDCGRQKEADGELPKSLSKAINNLVEPSITNRYKAGWHTVPSGFAIGMFFDVA